MKKLLALILLTTTHSTFAGDFDFGLYLAQEYVKKDVAMEQGIGESMQSGGITFAYNTGSIDNSLALENNPYDDYQTSSGNFSMLVGGGFISASDDKKFTVATVDSNDDHGSRSSNVSGTTIFGEIGYNYFINSKMDVFFNLGRASYGLNRSISACTDCPEEEVTVNASNYIHTGLSFSDSPKIKVGYQHHNKGDMINSLRLQFAW